MATPRDGIWGDDRLFFDIMADGTEQLSMAPEDGLGHYIIRVLNGPEAGTRWDLNDGPCLVGKNEQAQIRLSDSAVSGRHALFELVDGRVLVNDLGSTNGTRYQDVLVEKVAVPSGATIQLGRVRLLIETQASNADWPTSYGTLVGTSTAARRLYRTLKAIEGLEQTVLLAGETGVGKGHVAHEIHRHSARKNRAFEVFDCGAVPANLVESELFGHEKGAFTGADARREGLFERANGGTLFIDELGELPLELQPRLLRALADHEVRRVGGRAPIKVDVRVIAATNRDLRKMVAEKSFRLDLYHRLNVMQVQIPPLRDRREDIPALVERFLEDEGLQRFPLSASSLNLMVNDYEWPGNIRELRNVVVRTAALRQAGLDEEPELEEVRPDDRALVDEVKEIPFQEARKVVLHAFERDYVEHHLRSNGGNMSAAARAAGMDRSYFRRMVLRHGLEATE